MTIPQGIELGGAEVFDPERMRALYAVGYEAALAGPVWNTSPPGLSAEASSP